MTLAEILEEKLEEGRLEGKLEGESIGIKKGESIGIKKGKDIGKLEAATKLKAKGLADDLIAETLELPLETVENL